MKHQDGQSRRKKSCRKPPVAASLHHCAMFEAIHTPPPQLVRKCVSYFETGSREAAKAPQTPSPAAWARTTGFAATVLM